MTSGRVFHVLGKEGQEAAEQRVFITVGTLLRDRDRAVRHATEHDGIPFPEMQHVADGGGNGGLTALGNGRFDFDDGSHGFLRCPRPACKAFALCGQSSRGLRHRPPAPDKAGHDLTNEAIHRLAAAARGP